MVKELVIVFAAQIIIFGGGLITWYLKSKREDKLLAEERTRDFKIETYRTLLEPYIILFTFTASKREKDDGSKKLLSVKYKTAAFNLTTFGSDQVVRSFNVLMQSMFNADVDNIREDDNSYSVIMLSLIADFLLSIRMDLYTSNTKLERSEMIEFFITDIDNYRDAIDALKIDRDIYKIYNLRNSILNNGFE